MRALGDLAARACLAMLAALACCGPGPGRTAQAAAAELEEPDYAFLTGGPYTQGKGVIQLIWPTSYELDRGDRALASSLRTEWGFTDRLEGDVILGGRAGLGDQGGSDGMTDVVAGIRARVLSEPGSRVTLALGPQIVLPTGDEARGLGTGRYGYAWDLAVAKDWRGAWFNYVSVNLAATPEGRVRSSGERDLLVSTTSALALAWRALERPLAGGGHRDLHVFLELLDEREADRSALQLAPGLRYGLASPGGALLELGVSLPVRLDGDAPRLAPIFQLQYEASLAGIASRPLPSRSPGRGVARQPE